MRDATRVMFGGLAAVDLLLGGTLIAGSKRLASSGDSAADAGAGDVHALPGAPGNDSGADRQWFVCGALLGLVVADAGGRAWRSQETITVLLLGLEGVILVGASRGGARCKPR
ncbi:MAG: hypothetical protein R3B70_14500 [Polyangiaceae bacterium]